MRIDPDALTTREVYHLLTTAVVPRPIAWVSTISPEGHRNAAPFSFFQALTTKPPTVMISVSPRRGGGAKDTARNITETGEFVVNVVSEESALKMVETSGEFPPEVSEFEAVGLVPLASERIVPPRIEEAKVSLECVLDRTVEVGANTLFLGRVVLFHVRDDLFRDGKVDSEGLKPVGRLGATTYAPLREIVDLPRGAETSVVASEMLDFWRELRAETVRRARALDPEGLARCGPALLRLAHGAGAAFDAAAWTPQRLADALEAASVDAEAALRREGVLDPARLRRAVAEEARAQGRMD